MVAVIPPDLFEPFEPTRFGDCICYGVEELAIDLRTRLRGLRINSSIARSAESSFYYVTNEHVL